MTMTFGSGKGRGRSGRTVFVGFESALEFWRGDSNLGSYEDSLDPDGRLVRVEGSSLAQAITSEREVRELGIGLFQERPLDLLVRPGFSSRSEYLRLHRVKWALPSGSFVRTRDHLLVAVPELVFLHAATTYSAIELLKLGMELCGTYAIEPYSRYGACDRRRICSAHALRRYLRRCPDGIPGIAKARDAVRYLINNSHSPLESKVMLGLTLPAKKRGLGLPKPRLNDRRDATSLQAETIGKHTYFFDASWRGRLPSGARYAVDCEVDSNPHFRDESMVRSDAERRDNVQFMRALHISITSQDFADADRFLQKGLMIAHHIGQRVRRYPRRGSEEDKEAFRRAWDKRVSRLGDLLEELSSDAHPPRPRPRWNGA